MTRKPRLKIILAALMMTGAVTLPVIPAQAFIVFDPTNFSQNILTAIRTLQSNINEATQIANQVQGLANEARTLQSLPTSTLSAFQTQFSALLTFVNNIQGLAQDYVHLQAQFEHLFPDYSQVTGTLSTQAVSADLQKWLDNNRTTLQGAVTTGAALLQQLPQNQADIATLVNSSQGAQGALQALQAGNQLSAQIAGQLMNLNTQMGTYQQAQMAYLLERNAEKVASQRRLQDVMKDWNTPVTAPPISANPF